ncbi:MAG: hypothetical protein J0H63_15395 [Rhizobiales bacterium]|nr:hypothetical protein [Hyphomicrobiales bacterium]
MMKRMGQDYHGTTGRPPAASSHAAIAHLSAEAGAALATFRRYVAWLREDAFPVWRRAGFDTGTGLFFEKLTLAGRPDRNAELRLRTHMRQVYSFAHGAALGLADGPAGSIASPRTAPSSTIAVTSTTMPSPCSPSPTSSR